MRILVTGAAGFIGFHTAARLLDRGDEVVGLDNMSPYYDVSLKEARLARLAGRNGFHFIKADLADQEIVQAVFAEEKPEHVIHLAAQAGVRYSLRGGSEFSRWRWRIQRWSSSLRVVSGSTNSLLSAGRINRTWPP